VHVGVVRHFTLCRSLGCGDKGDKYMWDGSVGPRSGPGRFFLVLFGRRIIRVLDRRWCTLGAQQGMIGWWSVRTVSTSGQGL